MNNRKLNLIHVTKRLTDLIVINYKWCCTVDKPVCTVEGQGLGRGCITGVLVS